MSKFVTSIAVDVESVKKLLPGKAFFAEVRFNREASTVEIVWEDDNLVTPFTNATEFKVEFLRDRQLPKGVRLRKDVVQKPKSAAPAVAPAAGRVPVKQPGKKVAAPGKSDRTAKQGKGDKGSEGVGESESASPSRTGLDEKTAS